MMMEIAKLNSVYPNPQPVEILEMRAFVWLEDLNHISEELFLGALKLCRQQLKFFPTIADVLERYQDVVRNSPEPLSLPEPQIELTAKEEAERKRMIVDFRAGKRNAPERPQSVEPCEAVKTLISGIGCQ